MESTPGTMITVRAVRSEDWRQVRRVRLAALAESPQAFVETIDQLREMADGAWRELVGRGAAGENSTCVLACGPGGGGAVGMAVGFKDIKEARAIWLAALWVEPGHRGQGVAARLVAAVRDWALEKGARELRAQVAEQNPRAIGFYEALGFRGAVNDASLFSSSSGRDTLFVLDLDENDCGGIE